MFPWWDLAISWQEVLKGKTAVEKGSQESRLRMIAIGTVVTMKRPVDPQRKTDFEIRQDWRQHHFRFFRAFFCESRADHSSGKRDYILFWWEMEGEMWAKSFKRKSSQQLHTKKWQTVKNHSPARIQWMWLQTRENRQSSKGQGSCLVNFLNPSLVNCSSLMWKDLCFSMSALFLNVKPQLLRRLMMRNEREQNDTLFHLLWEKVFQCEKYNSNWKDHWAYQWKCVVFCPWKGHEGVRQSSVARNRWNPSWMMAVSFRW